MNVNVFYVGQDSQLVAEAIKNNGSFNASSILIDDLNRQGPIGPVSVSSDILYVFCSDKALVDDMLTPFATIPASRKIFFHTDGSSDEQDRQRSSEKLASIVQHRIQLLTELENSPQSRATTTPNFNEWSYQALATELAYHCKQHLIKLMGREELSEQQEWVRPLVGLFQAPVQSEPRSGTTDVAVCYSIAVDAYHFPESKTSQILSDYPPQETNANWESLFTLFYAMLVCYGKESVLSVVPNTELSLNEDVGAAPSSQFRSVFDALVRKSQESCFWRGETQLNGSVKITLVPKRKEDVSTVSH